MEMEIYDPISSKKRKIKDLEIALHEMPNQEEGKMESVKCVEFIVLGRNHEWKSWLFYDDFKEANPHIEI